MEYKVASLVHQSLANLTDDINLVAGTVAVAFSDQQLTGLALYHAPTIRTATRVSLLLVRVCETVCH